MAYVELDTSGEFCQLNLTAGDAGNTLRPEVVEAWHAALDDLPASGNTALLVTSDHAKMFSAGIDLDYIKEQGFEALVRDFIPMLDDLLLRLAKLDMPTVAGINGHAYGGGALLATACDFRIMRADKGRFCFPEIDIPIAFSRGMQQLLNAKLPQPQKERLCFTGEAVTGEVLVGLGLASAAPNGNEFSEVTTTFVQQLAKKDRATYAQIKQSLLLYKF